jgi:hypothetical protein
MTWAETPAGNSIRQRGLFLPTRSITSIDQASIPRNDDDELAENRFVYLVERRRFVAAECRQKMPAGRIVGQVTEQAIGVGRQRLVEIPGLANVPGTVMGHAVILFPASRALAGRVSGNPASKPGIPLELPRAQITEEFKGRM